MYVNIPPHFISRIEELRRKLPFSHTLTPSSHHLDLLDESISLFKLGCRFLPVIGASAVVESCLLADKRRKSKHNTLKEYCDLILFFP